MRVLHAVLLIEIKEGESFTGGELHVCCGGSVEGLGQAKKLIGKANPEGYSCQSKL